MSFSVIVSLEAMQEHFFLIYVVGRVWFFDCVVYRACAGVAADIS